MLDDLVIKRLCSTQGCVVAVSQGEREKQNPHTPLDGCVSSYITQRFSQASKSLNHYFGEVALLVKSFSTSRPAATTSNERHDPLPRL